MGIDSFENGSLSGAILFSGTGRSGDWRVPESSESKNWGLLARLQSGDDLCIVLFLLAVPQRCTQNIAKAGTRV